MNAPLVRVDFASPIAVYEQIRNQIAFHVRSGRLEASSVLPSIRQLAEDLGVAKATVARSYDALQQEGLIEAERGQGMRVVQHVRPLGKKQQSKELNRALREFLAELEALGIRPEQVLAELKTLVRSEES